MKQALPRTSDSDHPLTPRQAHLIGTLRRSRKDWLERRRSTRWIGWRRQQGNVRAAVSQNETSMVMRYQPFPEGDAPEGWPTVYVAAEQYDRLREALRLIADGCSHAPSIAKVALRD